MNFLILFLTLFIKFCSCDEEDVDLYQSFFKREYSLVQPYQGSGMTIPFWDFFGSTIVTNSFIKLTPDLQSKQGGIFNTLPVSFKNWEVEFEIKVGTAKKNLYGDGMAFWYVKEFSKSGPVFGYQDQFNGLGIFLDTYANQNGAHNHVHPYISAMVNNGTAHYDHDRDGTHTEISGCVTNFRGTENVVIISVKYSNNVLTVSTDIEGKNEFKKCFSVKDVLLPTEYYFGVTAATGDLSDDHYLYSFRTYELVSYNQNDEEDYSKIIPSALSSASHRPHKDDPVKSMSNFKFFFLILCGIIGVVFLIAIAILIFNKQNENKRKRFY